MRIRLNPAMLGLLLLAVPVAALANLTGTPTLSANTALSLDTGATSASGGDILWSGSAMTPQSSATAYNIGALGATGFSAMTQSTLSSFSSLYSKTALPASTLVVGDVFAVKTNAGNYAAVLVTATAGTSITLQFTTFGVNSGPTITVVENNYGDVPAGFSNSGIAQGALFFVFGSGLATPGTVAVLQNAVGNILPTTINGASIKVTVGSTTVTPAMYYAQPTAVAGVLPSNTPLGAGTVTVTYNNQTSNSYNIQVVASAMGFDAWNQGGTGLGVATNPSTGVLYTYSNSIPPGTVITLWGSGLGADPKPTRDTTYVAVTSVAADSINGLTHIYVGGVDGGAPGYQGASGYPGLNQINFTIPANAPTGCNVSMVGTNSAGVPTNIVTLPIGTGTCSDPTFGTNGAQLQTLSGQTTVTTGLVGIFQSTTPSTSGSGTTVLAEASAIFESYTGSTYAYSGGQVSIAAEFQPDLGHSLRDAHSAYKLPVLISENGIADAQDLQRPAFLRSHIAEIRAARRAAIPVIGYLHWSLTDNFEWALGFAPRFGLVEMDYATGARRPRTSFQVYKEIIAKDLLKP